MVKLDNMLLLLALFSLSGLNAQKTLEEEHHFLPGEELTFKLSYGWFTLGKATSVINDSLVSYKGDKCYKIDVKGTTAGLLGVFTDVNDSWGAYINPETLRPLHAYKDIQEGKYMRIAKSDYDYDNGVVIVEKYNPKKSERKPPKTFEISPEDWDFLSAYLNLRNYDWEKLHKGDSVEINAFYEKSFYRVFMEYDGRVTLKSKVGKLKAHKVFLLMEKPNDIFPNERAIVAYISDDPNHLPLRIEANMFFGKAYCDLVSYRNIKYGPDFN